MTSFVTMTTRKILPSDWPKVYFHLLKPDKFQIVYLGENNKNIITKSCKYVANVIIIKKNLGLYAVKHCIFPNIPSM